MMPKRPTAPKPTVGQAYQYQGRQKDFSGKQVRVIADRWPGSSSAADACLVHVQVLGRKGQPTEATFGCHPGWLSQSGPAPYTRYHNELAKGNKAIKAAKVEPIGLVDPEDQDQLLLMAEDDD